MPDKDCYPADAVEQVARKAAHALCDDDVQVALHRRLHHEPELGTVLRICPAETVIDVCPHVFPVGVCPDLFLVFVLLQLDRYDLVDVVGRYAAVRRLPTLYADHIFSTNVSAK